MIRYLLPLLLMATPLLFSSCAGGSSGDGADGGSTSANIYNCSGACENRALSTQAVTTIIQQAIASAQSLSVNATFAVVDRVGNVLAVYQMAGANPTTTITGQIGAQGGLEGLSVPSTLAAISKAGTGAYLSSQGNAFSTRTASQIIQEHFDPGDANQPGGPLFGVQFSQLLCSDITVLNSSASNGVGHGRALATGGSIGPRPLPLGLSADPGGLPLYIDGDVVGGIGVEFNGTYTLDRNIRNYDNDPEERIALTATIGFEAPSQRVASEMSVGKTLRYCDLNYSDLTPLPETLPPFDSSALVAVQNFSTATVNTGATFGDPSSGIAETVAAGLPAAILVGPDGANRFPIKSGAPMIGGVQLQSGEVGALLDSALTTAHRARAAIRRPLDTEARVSIWVIDNLGQPLGFIRAQDAPVFGIDVALQKARAALFFSSPGAAQKLTQAALGSYVTASDQLFSAPAFTGATAFAVRAISNIARPFFTDGFEKNANGPLSLPYPGSSASVGATSTWSPFNTGLQLDLIFNALAKSLGLLGPVSSIPDSCANPAVFGSSLANGIQIFPGGVPLYRNGVVIGAIGVSGDGIDQDDLVAFYGASRSGLDYIGAQNVGDATLGFNAPYEIRSDRVALTIGSSRLRYVNCPESAFIRDNSQTVCEGL